MENDTLLVPNSQGLVNGDSDIIEIVDGESKNEDKKGFVFIFSKR